MRISAREACVQPHLRTRSDIIVYFDTRGHTGDSLTARVKMQCAKRPCGLMYRTIFFFTNSCKPELAHRLQTSKMRRNSTSLDRCQHDDINIVTVSVARRRWTTPLTPRRPCVKHFTTFYALLKHVSLKGDYFTPKGLFFAHWCEKRPFSLAVNVLHACSKKKILLIFENFNKFSNNENQQIIK